MGDNSVARPTKSDQSTQSAGTPRHDAVDAALRVAHSQTIERALALDLEEIDLQAIAQARHDLQSGRLDTAQNARTAAQNILEFGV